MKRLLTLALLWNLATPALALADEPVPIGTRRELFVDDSLVERLVGRAELRLHHPTPRSIEGQALEVGGLGNAERKAEQSSGN